MTCAALILAFVGGVAAASAQEPTLARSRPTFDVASVKPNTSGDYRLTVQVQPSGRVVIVNTPLRQIIALAYQIDRTLASHLVVGGSDEIMNSRFDVAAVPLPDTVPFRSDLMLRSMLEERFGLRARIEPRQIPVFAMKVRAEGRLGRALQRATADCDEYLAAAAKDQSVLEPTDDDGVGWCRRRIQTNSNGVTFRDAGPLSRLIQSIQIDVDRPIVDKTDLTGYFGWTVTFLPTAVARKLPVSATWGGPEVQVAFREQLGLTLEPEIVGYDVLVIDSVARPMPD